MRPTDPDTDVGPLATESGRDEIAKQVDDAVAAGAKVRFGGKVRHTGIDAVFEVVHLWTFRDGKVSELAMYPSRDEALEAADETEWAVSQERS